MDKKKLDTIERHNRVQMLQRCARINTGTTPYEVAQCLREYLFANTTNVLIRESQYTSTEHVFCFNTKDYSHYWVVIIREEDIRKFGRDCLTVYHMNHGIDFSKTYSFPNYNLLGFCNSYEALCDMSKHLLYRYDSRLSCEALVSEMQFIHNVM